MRLNELDAHCHTDTLSTSTVICHWAQAQRFSSHTAFWNLNCTVQYSVGMIFVVVVFVMVDGIRTNHWNWLILIIFMNLYISGERKYSFGRHTPHTHTHTQNYVIRLFDSVYFCVLLSSLSSFVPMCRCCIVIIKEKIVLRFGCYRVDVDMVAIYSLW